MPSFDDSACVLLNAKGEMMGTRISGPISAGLRNIEGNQPGGRWAKVLAIAPKVSMRAIVLRIGADLQGSLICVIALLWYHMYTITTFPTAQRDADRSRPHLLSSDPSGPSSSKLNLP